MADARQPLPPWIPAEVSEALREAAEGKHTGHVEVHYKNGVVGHVAERRSRLIASNCPTGQNSALCPGCGAVMEPYDYGNGYRCGCGVKRTRSQLTKERLEREGIAGPDKS